mgnify:CR=1 FL=1
MLDPHGGALVGDAGRAFGEALVDVDVGVPPLAVELRRCDDVVVERPQGAVGEAFVVLLDLQGRERDRFEPDSVVLERLQLLVGRTVPADPRTALASHDGFEGRHQTAR